MMGTAFFIECRQIVKSITYAVFLVVLVIFSFTQTGSEFKKIEKPQKNQESYGTKYVQIPEIIMPNAVKQLYGEFRSNSYTAYPFGFFKVVKLNDKKQNEIAGILSKLTGLSETEIKVSAGIDKKGMSFKADDMVKDKNGNFKVVIPEGTQKQSASGELDVTIDKGITYESFGKLMEHADSLIGGGSKYDDIYLVRFGEVPMTYEDALADYNSIVQKDRITGAYARLFCDYLGIILAIFPVFLTVATSLKDRRAKMQDLIYARAVSSLKVVAARYSAIVVLMFLPVLFMAVYVTFKVTEGYTGLDIDMLAFVKYSFGWLFPTLMVSAAVGTFLTELTDTPIAIAVQGFWWFAGLFAGMKYINGGYGASLALRHNTVGNTQVYFDNYNTLVLNRICYTFFAVLLILFSVCIYELKRRGRLNVYDRFKKVFTHCKSESEM